MGCAKSQHEDTAKPKEKFDFYMTTTHIPEFDSVFNGVATPLRTLTEICESFSYSHRNFTSAVGVRKRIQQKTIADAVMAMLYCYSTSSNGDLETLKLKVTKAPPFYDVNKDSLRPEFRQIPGYFESFVATLIRVTDRLEPLKDQIETAASRCAGSEYVDFPERATSAAEQANLGFIGTGKAVKATASNVSKLTKAPALLKKVMEKARRIQRGLEEVAARTDSDEGTKEEVRRVGRAAFEAQCFKPEELVPRFWPDQSRVLPASTRA